MAFRQINYLSPMIPVIVSMMVGIWGANAFEIPRAVLAVLFLLTICGFISRSFDHAINRPVILLCCLCFAWGAYAMIRMDNTEPGPHGVAHFCNGQKLVVKGTIASFQKHYPGKIRVRLDLKTMTAQKNQTQTITGSVLLNIYNPQTFKAGYGDDLLVQTKLRPIENFDNPGGFDYKRFLKQKGISALAHANASGITVIPNSGLSLKWIRSIENARNGFFHFVQENLDGSDSADILCALITGKKRMISPEIRDRFSRAGTSHLLAISGLHMSILALVFYGFWFLCFSFIRPWLISGRAKKYAMITTLSLLFVYSIFCGFSQSTRRAYIMIFVFMVSFIIEKESHPLNTLALAAVMILLIQPAALYSVSFQLSFISVLSILVLLDLARSKNLFSRNRVMSRILTAVLVTFAAGMGTFPLVACYFNMISHVQIPANLVLVPVLGFICLYGGFAAFLCFILGLPFARDLVLGCGWIIDQCLEVIGFLTRLPFAWSRCVTPDALDLFLIYGLMACLVWFGTTCEKKMAVWILALFLITATGHWGQKLQKRFYSKGIKVMVLDVGQGSSSLVLAPGGHAVLVDGGGFSSRSLFDVGRYVVAPVLWRQNILTLDAVILTHPEADHMNGLVFILENFKVKMMVKSIDQGRSRAYENLMDLCQTKRIPVKIPGCAWKGFSLDQASLSFFQCQGVFSRGQVNDNSLVFKLVFHEFLMLFPGDIMSTREYGLSELVGPGLQANILLAPHHGSGSSSNDFFLDQVKPESVIISCGLGNRYNFPDPQVMERYRARQCRVFRTDIDGAVTISSCGSGYEILTQKGR